MVPENQKRAAAYLQKVLESGKTPPAMLLYGPAGAGKGYLAFRFARHYLLSALQRGGWKILREEAELQIDRWRFPDMHLFSARDLAGEIDAVSGALERLSLDGARTLVFRLQGVLLCRLDPTLFDLKKVKISGGQDAAELLHQIEQGTVSAEDHAELASVLERMAELARVLPGETLPVQGVRELIHRLTRRAVFGTERAVIIEGIQHLRVESANAFLKTLEEPPQGTVILLTADSLQGVLPTIKSRCALVPVPRMPAQGLQQLAEVYGYVDAPRVDGVTGFYRYLQECAGNSDSVHKDLVEFFDFVDEGDSRPDLFDFLQQIVDRGAVRSFLTYLHELILDCLAAGTAASSDDRLLLRLVQGDDPFLLRRIEQEIRQGLPLLDSLNFNPAALLYSIYSAFFLSRNGGGYYAPGPGVR